MFDARAGLSEVIGQSTNSHALIPTNGALSADVFSPLHSQHQKMHETRQSRTRSGSFLKRRRPHGELRLSCPGLKAILDKSPICRPFDRGRLQGNQKRRHSGIIKLAQIPEAKEANVLQV